MSKTFTTIGMSAEVTIEAAAIEGADAKGPKRFTSVFYTGGLVTVKGWDQPVVIDLAGVEQGNVLVANLDHDKTKRVAYNKQTAEAQATGKSNCPLCAVGENSNKSKLYAVKEMDADHVSAWSKGGESSANNCQMLCITHNRAKGNR